MDILKLQSEIPVALENAEKGLPDEVFSFVASVTPMVNVDLLIQDAQGRFLFACGIVRFKETFSSRLHKTAIRELKSDVTFDETPIKITEIFMPYQRRGHFISFLYKCYLPQDYAIDNSGKKTNEDGYLKWHEVLPELVDGQKCYEEFLKNLVEKS